MALNIIDKYFNWLCHKMQVDKRHLKVCRFLFETPFRWSINLDENRLYDGLRMRDQFYDEKCGGDNSEQIGGPCNLFEMLAAFSQRIEIQIMGEPGNDDIARWFWEMLTNLDLNYTDDELDETEAEEKIDIWLDREFDENGEGSPFPQTNPAHDQRYVDMWYQMQTYLVEKHPI